MVTRILPAKDVAVRAAGFEGTGRECEWRIEGNQGLVLAVMAPGRSGASSKIWRAYYSLTRDGRRTVRKLRLGAYPRVGLAEARRRAAEVSEAVERGQDPVGEARATKADLARQSLTFADLVADYMADHRRERHATSDDLERVLVKDALPTLGHLHPASITALDVQRTIDAVRDRVAAKRGEKTKGEMARRVLRYIKQVFNHALLDNEVLRLKYGFAINPAEAVGRSRRGKVGRYGKAKPRSRFLTDDEVVAFWCTLDASSVDGQTRLLLKILLVTGARLSEVRCMDIAELRLDGPEPVWNLPAHRAKNREAHAKPLSPLAVSLLRQAIGGRVRGPALPSSKSKDGFLDMKGARRAISRFLERGRLICAPFTPHDFRRTVGSGMARLGIRDDIIGRALGHKKSDVTNAVYIQGGYENEKRDAMVRWSEHLERLIFQEASAA